MRSGNTIVPRRGSSNGGCEIETGGAVLGASDTDGSVALNGSGRWAIGESGIANSRRSPA
ncbi:hypothetical protein D3C83_304250 [compost metagenome]